MPSTQEWKMFARWGDEYGPIIHVSLFGQPVIILNTFEAASALLDKRGHIYCDRPILHFAGEIVGWKSSLTLARYGPHTRESRRLFHQVFGTQAAFRPFHETIEMETMQLLVRLLETPQLFRQHLRLNAGAIILKISHGYNAQGNDDPFIRLAALAAHQFSQSMRPGAFLVDIFPMLRFVPDWVPGTAWKQKAKEWSLVLNDMVDLPHSYVKEEMEKGTALPSFTLTHLLEKSENMTPEYEYSIKWTASTIMSAGADTTVSATSSFFLAMMLHLDVQRKAQAELDAVIGNHRLPSLADRARLPYIEALVSEVLRWNPLGPIGGPRRAMKDDVYNGYHIPKGSNIVPNVWKMLHDEKLYQDPVAFKPERFINTAEKVSECDPRNIAFGFGRRSCPGLLLADTSLFMTCAMVLSVFNISPPPDCPASFEYTDGLISHPPPFKCNIVARTEAARALVETVRRNGDA
ncbi:cytochrome P450 [Dentipellis sp. KUC8613]|nr:cytochrome P450 [Dentipellis sp. KUC8613]